jgi:hypothetical protein
MLADGCGESDYTLNHGKTTTTSLSTVLAAEGHPRSPGTSNSIGNACPARGALVAEVTKDDPF